MIEDHNWLTFYATLFEKIADFLRRVVKLLNQFTDHCLGVKPFDGLPYCTFSWLCPGKNIFLSIYWLLIGHCWLFSFATNIYTIFTLMNNKKHLIHCNSPFCWLLYVLPQLDIFSGVMKGGFIFQINAGHLPCDVPNCFRTPILKFHFLVFF